MILLLGLLSAAYNENLNSGFLLRWTLLLGIIWG